MRSVCLFLVMFLSAAAPTGAEPPQRPLIDVHRHAGPANWSGPGAPSDPANDNHLRTVLLEMDRFNVRLAIISGPIEFVEYWKKKAPDRFVASPLFPCDRGVAPLGGRQCFPSGSVVPDLGWLRSRYSSGAFGAMGEITAQYAGLSPSDGIPGMETYVFSRTLRKRDYPDVTILGEQSAETLATLRSKSGKDIWLFGGGSLFHSLLKAGLVDTTEVAIIPVLLGGGIPLLPPPAKQTKLNLTGHNVYKTGIVSLEYAVQQPVA